MKRRKDLYYDPSSQPGVPHGPISGPWEKIVQFGLNFWLLDVLAFLAMAHLTVGIRWFSMGVMISSKDGWTVLASGTVVLVLGVWLLYRWERRGNHRDDGPDWFSNYFWWLP